MILGPFSRAAANAKAEEVGNMTRAQVVLVREFLQVKMMMSEDEVNGAGIVGACWTDNDCILAKFKSIQQARALNNFKKNLPKDCVADDFAPPA